MLAYKDHIFAPLQLYEWAVKNISNFHFHFPIQEEYVESAFFINNCFSPTHTCLYVLTSEKWTNSQDACYSEVLLYIYKNIITSH